MNQIVKYQIPYDIRAMAALRQKLIDKLTEMRKEKFGIE